MRILSVNIVAFGKLKGVNITFDKGLNVLRQTNGFGKTTLANFIRAMLYGFGYSRGKGGTDASRWQPWDGTPRFGGSMTVEHNGESIRIERFFGATARAETCRIFNNRTGAELNWQLQPGEQLLGLTADSYDRSAYFPQEAVELSGNDNLESRLAKLVQSSAEDYDKVRDRLRAYKKNLRYEKGVGGLIADLEAQQSDLERQLHDAEQSERRRSEIESRLKQIAAEKDGLQRQQVDLKSRSEQLRDMLTRSRLADEQTTRADIAEVNARLGRIPPQFESDFSRCDEIARQLSAPVAPQEKPRKRMWLLGVAATLVLAGAALISLGVLNVLSTIVGVIAGCISVAFGVACLFGVSPRVKNRDMGAQNDGARREFFAIASRYVNTDGKDAETVRRALWELRSQYLADIRARETLSQLDPQADVDGLQNKLAETEGGLAQLTERANALLAEEVRLGEEYKNLVCNKVEIEDRILTASERRKQAEYAYNVAETVMGLLERAKDNLSGSYLPRLCKRTTELLREITASNAEVVIDRNFAIGIIEEGRTKPMSAFSRGTREITLLCFRVALSETLYDGDIPFLIIDDAFVNFDENNFVRATALLNKLSERAQVLYFTCHSRIGKLLK